jgi:hypothetical protein
MTLGRNKATTTAAANGRRRIVRRRTAPVCLSAMTIVYRLGDFKLLNLASLQLTEKIFSTTVLKKRGACRPGAPQGGRAKL